MLRLVSSRVASREERFDRGVDLLTSFETGWGRPMSSDEDIVK